MNRSSIASSTALTDPGTRIDTLIRQLVSDREMIIHIVTLPIPPSTNRLWRHGRDHMYPTPDYEGWKRNADAPAMAQRVQTRGHTIDGPFAAHVEVGPSRADLDNVGSKALLDWAQSRNLIANDKYLKRLSVERVSSTEAPEGCRLTLVELGVS